MSDPTLSIVTPSYEQGRYIEQCIMSVKTQPFEDVEHIVVDGGSTDRTVEILERHEEDYDLKWISEPDDGQSDAINKGIEMASGDWIGWQNSDDFYLPGAFDVIDRYGESECDFLYGDVLVVDGAGRPRTRLYQTRASKLIHRYWSLFARNQASFLRSSLLESVGPIDETLEQAMDEDLFWRVLQSEPNVKRVSRALGAFRVHEAAKTFKGFERRRQEERKRIYGPRTLPASLVPEDTMRQFAKILKYGSVVRDRPREAVVEFLGTW
jgi:glycosyltransferase involved in cell wall biosynthesis